MPIIQRIIYLVLISLVVLMSLPKAWAAKPRACRTLTAQVSASARYLDAFNRLWTSDVPQRTNTTPLFVSANDGRLSLVGGAFFSLPTEDLSVAAYVVSNPDVPSELKTIRVQLGPWRALEFWQAPHKLTFDGRFFYIPVRNGNNYAIIVADASKAVDQIMEQASGKTPKTIGVVADDAVQVIEVQGEDGFKNVVIGNRAVFLAVAHHITLIKINEEGNLEKIVKSAPEGELSERGRVVGRFVGEKLFVSFSDSSIVYTYNANTLRQGQKFKSTIEGVEFGRISALQYTEATDGSAFLCLMTKEGELEVIDTKLKRSLGIFKFAPSRNNSSGLEAFNHYILAAAFDKGVQVLDLSTGHITTIPAYTVKEIRVIGASLNMLVGEKSEWKYTTFSLITP